MDGTIVDTEGMWWQAVSEVALRLGGTLTSEDEPDVLGRPVEHAATHLLRRTRGLVEKSRGRHRGQLDTPDPGGYAPAAVEAMLTRAFTARIGRGVTILPGAIALLEGLRAAAIPTALVSASPRSIVDMVLETIGAHRFNLTVAAEDSARNKPSPDPYLTAAALLGVDSTRGVASEDSPTGLAAARAAGCAVVLVSGAHTVPDRVVAVRTLETVNVALLHRLIAGDLVSSHGNNDSPC
jgi:HAD superfamily hydrolase (TIGR01509 family)